MKKSTSIWSWLVVIALSAVVLVTVADRAKAEGVDLPSPTEELTWTDESVQELVQWNLSQNTLMFIHQCYERGEVMAFIQTKDGRIKQFQIKCEAKEIVKGMEL